MFPQLHSWSIRLFAVFAVVALTAVALVGSPSPSSASVSSAKPTSMTAEQATKLVTSADGVLRFETAEDHTRAVWAGNPKLTDGLPANDATFMTQGYIYPAGTLTETNGVLPDGSPEFPDKVLGQWSCYGWWVGAGEADETAPWISTHIFNFGSAAGEAMLVTAGYDIDDMEISLDRAVTGGSGLYAGAQGVQSEVNLGFNKTGGVNVTYEVRLAEA
jgi:hypothetical protein